MIPSIISTALCEEETFVFNIEANDKRCVLTDIYVIIFNRQGVITEKKFTTYNKKLSQVFLFNYSLQNGINLFCFLGLSVCAKYTSLCHFSCSSFDITLQQFILSFIVSPLTSHFISYVLLVLG